uniref:IGv domain-containing protein n=1 Tax=Echinostoma caproni TaxID=27848 RepID=A0A183ACP5_9TREM
LICGLQFLVSHSVFFFCCLHSRSARAVELLDTFPDSDFIQIHGSQSVRWSSIPAASNLTHAVVVIPRKPGPYNFTSATVNYIAGEDDKTTVCTMTLQCHILLCFDPLICDLNQLPSLR